MNEKPKKPERTIYNSNTAPKPDTSKNAPPPQTKSNPGNNTNQPTKK